MAERRSLGQAIQITPEKLAFIQGEGSKKSAGVLETPENPKTVELEMKSTEPELPSEAKVRTSRRPRGKSESVIPNAGELLDQVLVPITIRVQHRTSQALKRAYLEQRLRHAKPDTQQEIVEEALSDWLQRQGFLE